MCNNLICDQPHIEINFLIGDGLQQELKRQSCLKIYMATKLFEVGNFDRRFVLMKGMHLGQFGEIIKLKQPATRFIIRFMTMEKMINPFKWWS